MGGTRRGVKVSHRCEVARRGGGAARGVARQGRRSASVRASDRREGGGAGGGAWVAAWVGAREGGAPQRVGHLAAHHVELRQVLRVLQHVEPLVPSRVVAQVLLQQLLYVGELLLPAAKRAEDPLAVAPRVVVLRIATLAEHGADEAELLRGSGSGLA